MLTQQGLHAAIADNDQYMLFLATTQLVLQMTWQSADVHAAGNAQHKPCLQCACSLAASAHLIPDREPSCIRVPGNLLSLCSNRSRLAQYSAFCPTSGNLWVV